MESALRQSAEDESIVELYYQQNFQAMIVDKTNALIRICEVNVKWIAQ